MACSTKRASAGTPITAHELPVLAAVLARSNMGQALPDRLEVESLLRGTHRGDPVSIGAAVAQLCQQFMENDEHYDMFVKEAEWWASSLRGRGRSGYHGKRERVAVHADVAHLMWPGQFPAPPARRGR